MDWLSSIFDTTGFPPRWHCGTWSPGLGWLHIISDLLIFASYMAIPLVIVAYVRRRREVLFPGVFWIFCAFIFFCGTTHLIDAVVFWHPVYPLLGASKLLTAIVSVTAVIITARIMPKALALPGLAAINRQLQGEVAARTASQQALAEQTRRVVEHQRRLLAAQSLARLGDWTLDLASQRVEWSPEVFRLFQRDPELGPPADWSQFLDLFAPASRTTIVESTQQAEERLGQQVEAQAQVVLPSGTTIWLHAIVQAITDESERAVQIWGTAQDITRQKEQTLAEARQRFELERINQQLEQFAYIASHDLTEPLRKVRFFGDILREELGAELSEVGQDALERMSSATARMNRLVQDLLSFARAGKSLTNPGPVSLDEVVREVLDLCEARTRAAAAVIEVEPLPVVLGEQGLLVQVFQNLVVNALKYRHPERPVRIRISAVVLKGQAEITMSDNGLGFDADQAGRLFEPFVRLHRSGGQEGTGIGLAICRRILEVHGGSITAQPVPDGGARFIVRLPTTGTVRSL